jgi:pyroglutamyl-peptidase
MRRAGEAVALAWAISLILSLACDDGGSDGDGDADTDVDADSDTDSDGDGDSGSDEIVISTQALEEARLGLPYQLVLEAEGGQAPYTWDVIEGALPDGIALDPTSGTLSGSPRETGSFPITIEVADGSEPALTASAVFDLVVPRVVLLGGYGPWAGYPVNPAWEAIRPLDGARIADLEVRAFMVEVVWDVAWDQYQDHLDLDLPPAATIGTGVAGGMSQLFSLERRAVNREDGVDVEGNGRSGDPVVEGGPDELASTLPLDEIGAALFEADIDWTYSDSAGTYLCNHLFYHLVDGTQGTDIAAGFIHINDGDGTVPIEDLTAGWRIIIEALAGAI